MKDDKDKDRIDLLPIDPLFDIAKVFEFGANKYEANSWKTDIEFSRVYSSIMRHMMSWKNGRSIDPESGLNHVAHAGAQIMILLQYIRDREYMDDR